MSAVPYFCCWTASLGVLAASTAAVDTGIKPPDLRPSIPRMSRLAESSFDPCGFFWLDIFRDSPSPAESRQRTRFGIV